MMSTRYVSDDDLSDAVSETVEAFSLLHSMLCHRLQAIGVMSADDYRRDLLRMRDSMPKALPSHVRGDDRLALKIIDHAIDKLNIGSSTPKPWKPFVIDGGKR